MTNNQNQYSIQITQSPWEIYDNLDATLMYVIVDSRPYNHNQVWLPSQLQSCTLRFDLSNCDLENLYNMLLSKGITPLLAVTVEDSSSWQSYTQKYDLSLITPRLQQIVEFRSKILMTAHEGLVVRIRIIAKHINTSNQKALQKNSILAERSFNLHVDTHASDFSVKLVDKLENKSGFRVVMNPNSDPFSEPIYDCVTIEFNEKAYLKYQQITTTEVRNAISSFIVSHIISEAIYCIVGNDSSTEDFSFDQSAIVKPMVQQLCELFGFQSFQEFQKIYKERPDYILNQSRNIVAIEDILQAL